MSATLYNPKQKMVFVRGVLGRLIGAGLVALLAWTGPLLHGVRAQGAVTGTIAFAQDDLGNDWRRAQVTAVKRVLDQYPGVDFRVTDAGGEPAVQALHIDRFVQQGVDVLITSPAQARILDPALKRARKAGVPVILLDRRTTTPAFTSFVHPDNRRITRRLARSLFRRMGDAGRVLMLKGVPGATPTRHRTQAFLAMADDRPNVEVTTRTANYLRGDAILAVDRLLRQGEGFPFDAIYAQSDSMAEGARIALRRNGIDPKGLVIAGIDYIRQAQAAIRRGVQDVSFTYPTGGAEGARLALRLLRGEPVPEEVVLESRQVTQDNADHVAPIF